MACSEDAGGAIGAGSPAVKRPRLRGGGEGAAPAAAKSDALLSWLLARGARLDGLEVRPDGCGGRGVFATRHFEPGAVIASVPVSAVLTAGKACATPLGSAAANAGASEDLVLWMCMAQGRHDGSDPWHPYLASLPPAQPDPTGWPSEALAPLRGTPLLKMVEECRVMLARELGCVLARLRETDAVGQAAAAAWLADGAHGEKLGLQHVLWARGLHLSRCFPAALACSEVSLRPDLNQEPPGGGGDGSEIGCLLPFFDLLNHRSGHPIAWESSGSMVSFRAVAALTPEDEVFNNYGCGRSNEQLLFFYGFAEADRQLTRDVVTGLTVLCDFADSDRELAAAKHRRLLGERVPCGLLAGGCTLRLGPFELGPLTAAEAGAQQQPPSLLPPGLLRALRITVSERGEDEELEELSPQALALLHSPLVAALAAGRGAPAPGPGEPPGRAASVRAYLAGRCRVLEAAVREVEDLLVSFDSDADDE